MSYIINMKRINFIKKIKLFLFYRKTIKSISLELESKFNSRIDNISRIYTVLNIPPNLIEEPYNIKKSDIDTISSSFIKEYSSELSKFMNNNGLVELYKFYEMKKVDKYSYLLIFGFSLFNTKKIANRLLIVLIPLLLILTILIYNQF